MPYCTLGCELFPVTFSSHSRQWLVGGLEMPIWLLDEARSAKLVQAILISYLFSCILLNFSAFLISFLPIGSRTQKHNFLFSFLYIILPLGTQWNLIYRNHLFQQKYLVYQVFRYGKNFWYIRIDIKSHENPLYRIFIY